MLWECVVMLLLLGCCYCVDVVFVVVVLVFWCSVYLV